MYNDQTSPYEEFLERGVNVLCTICAFVPDQLLLTCEINHGSDLPGFLGRVEIDCERSTCTAHAALRYTYICICNLQRDLPSPSCKGKTIGLTDIL